MTTEELMNIPKGMSFREYDKLLKSKKKLEKQLKKSKLDAKRRKVQAKLDAVINILKRQA